MSHIAKSKSSNLISPPCTTTPLGRRRNTIDSDLPATLTPPKLTFIDLFQAKNPFQLNRSKSFLLLQQQQGLTTHKKTSIRCSIFHKIVGLPNNNSNDPPATFTRPSLSQFNFKRFKSPDDIRQFWKKVISEQILLNRMEAENRLLQLKASLNRTTIDYAYPEITIDLSQVDTQWDEWLTSADTSLVANSEVLAALSKGVPQAKRGQVWLWLVGQHRKKYSQTKCDVTYADLLKQSTIHQHSILLDLGRTFPGHANFSKKFGSGQLALFNVLKAYSIVDPEVGYCQGLSFIVGILLIHVNNSEEKAFEMLRFLLIDLGLREQYRPDMKALQKYA